MILQVAIDAPLRRLFDYLPPPRASAEADTPILPGMRVRVPFGNKLRVGIVIALAEESSVAPARLKAVREVLDRQPVFDLVTFMLLRWAADYYHHPIGEVFAAALPAGLSDGRPIEEQRTTWELTAAGQSEVQSPSGRRAPRQRALLARLATSTARTTEALAGEFTPAQLRAAEGRGWIQTVPVQNAENTLPRDAPAMRPSEVVLTDAQRHALAAILTPGSRFAAHLLHGVTGSGKTEVYLRAIAAAIADGGQALVLVPEISLTPQLVARFRQRFEVPPAVLHSAMSGSERRDAWRRARSGEARVVIGTRSAVFASLTRLAMIIVDEEHDPSYKQQEGFRYSARDLAVLRAQRAGVPIILGSATPSLESLDNVLQGRYARLSLPERPGVARASKMTLVDMRRQPVEGGFSQAAIGAMSAHLGAGGQVIVFLNRRGYAPALYCSACRWVASCTHCDARMTLHRRAAQLRCHHCGAQRAATQVCEACGKTLHPVGQGTERIEETLERLFPGYARARLDRDTAGARGAADAVLERVHSGDARILVGTQMLTKGHHFPDVSLVVILNADQGLFATDYRAAERLAQTIVQVAGRAGRAARAGEVLIQTEFPDHPLLELLTGEGYDAFATSALAERRAARWPPYSRLALLRADAKDPARLDAFLRGAAALGSGEPHQPARGVPARILGPASAQIARRADRYRAHLLIEADDRPALQRFLGAWLPRVEGLAVPPGLRWSVDVDPLEVD
ncbi:MAG: primosomal protein N' [Steroidobacteraceae bacterium]|nr:primosomal protein N' [Steroidobacteraceae bacterium]